MVEISHEMIQYGIHIYDIQCCSCFYDEINFMLRHKISCEKFEEKFLKDENCYIQIIYGTIVVICHDILHFIEKKYSLFDRKKMHYRLFKRC